MNGTSAELNITSTGFENGELMPALYTCDGADTNPPLEISGIPAGAKSLVIIMDDPDVPKSLREDGMWDHWIKFNVPISGGAFSIAEGEDPAGVSGKGTSGNLNYHGPCPPSGTHHYRFRAYALDRLLDLKEGVSKTEVLGAMEGRVLAEGELVGLYNRNP